MKNKMKKAFKDIGILAIFLFLCERVGTFILGTSQPNNVHEVIIGLVAICAVLVFGGLYIGIMVVLFSIHRQRTQECADREGK